MLKNYFKIAVRNIRRNKIFTIINVGGLSVALAAAFFILVYVVNEFSYNKCHIKRDRIYRIITNKKEFKIYRAAAPYVLTPTIIKDFPEVESITRIKKLRNVEIKFQNNLIPENRFICADPDIFKIFTLPILLGSNEIEDKASIVISEKIARKYFGNKNPVNEILTATIRGEERLLKVKGVMKNIPHNSTLKADIIGNIKLSLEQVQKSFTYSNVETDWSMDWWETYLLFKKDVSPVQMDDKFVKLEKQYLPDYIKDHYELQSLNDVYLHSSHIIARVPQGDLSNLYLYLAIGIIILLIAGSNYIILSSALSSSRFKEIGIRKVIGATKKNIILQMLGESILLTFLSFAISIAIMEFAKPYAQSLFKYKFYFLTSNILQYIFGFLLIIILIGIFSGAYIALYLSSFEIVDILKNRFVSKDKIKIRKALFVFQFGIFAGLVFSSIIIYKQYYFVQKKDLGFDKNNIIIITFDDDEFSDYEAYLNNIRYNPNILNVTSAIYCPPTNSSAAVMQKSFDNPGKKVQLEILGVGFNFIETFKLKIIKGRSFSKKYSSDKTSAVILNETAVKELGIKNPIGKSIENYKIIGVVKDFNIHSLHLKVQPLSFRISVGKYTHNIIVKYKKGTYKNTIDYLKKEWKKVAGVIPFTYQTFEDALADLYEDEKTLLDIISFFTLLTIILAASGLFGLTLFTMRQRTKEIGIRKVLGASIGSIITLLSKEFLLLLLISNLLAWPIAYYYMNKWLQIFAYKIDIGIFPFVISLVIVVLISFSTILIQTVRTANANPVDSLRDE